MLPLVTGPVAIESDGAVVEATFRDIDGSELRLLVHVDDASLVPELQRVVPHEFTDTFTGGHHGYTTREDTTLSWEHAAWLLRSMAMHAGQDVAPRLDALARLADSRLPGGTPPPPSLDELLQSVSDCLFPADMGERKVELDSRDTDGDTPLHVLLWRRDQEGAARLVAAGADVNAAGDLEDTPLHVALRLKLAGAVAMLLAAGANPDAPNLFGDTPRHAAYKQGGAMADCFRAAGLDPLPPS
jgi:hypothetical protein